MIERLWCLKFTSVLPLPGNQLNAFFDDEENALKVFNEHAECLAGKQDGEMKVLVFQDLMGRQCLRSSWFPHCLMGEIGPSELAWTEIKKKCDASQREAGITQPVGFKREP